MTRTQLIISALGGITSLLLFLAGLVSASITLPLLMMSILPVVIVSLGWGTRAGYGAAGAATIGVLISLNIYPALLYAFAFGAPAAYLGHCVGLSRIDDETGQEEWFPLGNIFFRAVLYAGILIGLSLLVSGFDANELVTTLKQQLEEARGDLAPDVQENIGTILNDMIPIYVSLIPFAAPMLWLVMIVLNLWLGAKIVKQSGKLNRPRFSLSEVEMPSYSVALFALSLAASLLAPPLQYIGMAFTGSLVMAFTILGFNTIHVMVRGNSGRFGLLFVVYFMTIFIPFVVLIIVMLGIADLIFKIRQRFLAAQPIT